MQIAFRSSYKLILVFKTHLCNSSDVSLDWHMHTYKGNIWTNYLYCVWHKTWSCISRTIGWTTKTCLVLSFFVWSRNNGIAAEFCTWIRTLLKLWAENQYVRLSIHRMLVNQGSWPHNTKNIKMTVKNVCREWLLIIPYIKCFFAHSSSGTYWKCHPVYFKLNITVNA